MREQREQEQEEGRKAGIAFATDEAEYRDLLMLRKFLESPCDSDFAAVLFSHYPDRSYGEFADRLFSDEEAEPSDDFILAFARAAVEVLEEIERRKRTALSAIGAQFGERLKHQRTEKRRRLTPFSASSLSSPRRCLIQFSIGERWHLVFICLPRNMRPDFRTYGAIPLFMIAD